MNHTPGPWYARHNQVLSEFSSHGCTIVNCNSTSKGITDGEVEANARLVASAPELLEACKAMIERLTNMTTDEYSKGGEKDEREMMEKAIAKAEGRE